MSPYDEAPRKHLLESLRGHTIRIPDLQALLASWPQYANPELERLQKDVDERLQR